MREALEGRPEQERSRLQYERVLDAYRAIYHGNPASPKADASIAAVADLLAEEGRVFQDDKALQDAIGQYEFLRHQYPGSRYRFSALLTEGEIYQRDLGDTKEAKTVYQSFLRLYPRNALAEEARSELKNIRRERLTASRRQPESGTTGRGDAHKNAVLAAAIESQQKTPHRRTTEAENAPRREAHSEAQNENGSETQSRFASRHSQFEENNIPPPAAAEASAMPATKQAASQPVSQADSQAASQTSGAATTEAAADMDARMNAPPPPRAGRLPLITGIRHWSTPVYTRVAIDLQHEVRFEAARVPHPDRIFFDLYGTRLSPELVGHSVEVTDDGFLTRIRAAQFSDNVTRIVLDVNSVSEYSAFFLPNPSRLIIDVHGRRENTPPRQIAAVHPPAAAEHASESATRSAVAAPVFAAAVNAPDPEPARPVQSGVFPDAEIGSPLADVARLSSQPNQVKATRHPTMAPVVSSVAGTTPAAQPTVAQRTEMAAAKPAASVHAGDSAPPAEAGATGIPAPEPMPAEEHLPNSMVRALGLKINRIVIDAGHGGHDSGTLGPGGLEEKDVVLDVALRLGKLLKQRLGADVIYTRSDDTFVPLETRTAIANQAQADLFISIHANSSPDASARGVETYYLNFTTSADALEVAARENAVSDESIHQLSDLVKKIALQDKINESRELASDVEQSLYTGLEQGNYGLKDRGVKKAPFVVLIGANMPSILAEISFLTNPEDAHELREEPYRERIAESLYRGVARYVSNLNGVRLAQANARPTNSY